MGSAASASAPSAPLLFDGLFLGLDASLAEKNSADGLFQAAITIEERKAARALQKAGLQRCEVAVFQDETQPGEDYDPVVAAAGAQEQKSKNFLNKTAEFGERKLPQRVRNALTPVPRACPLVVRPPLPGTFRSSAAVLREAFAVYAWDLRGRDASLTFEVANSKMMFSPFFGVFHLFLRKSLREPKNP